VVAQLLGGEFLSGLRLGGPVAGSRSGPGSGSGERILRAIEKAHDDSVPSREWHTTVVRL